jgi:hypothetical protein
MLKRLATTLSGLLLVAFSAAGELPWRDTPQVIATLRLDDEFRSRRIGPDRRYEVRDLDHTDTLQPVLCARAEGEKGTSSYRQLVSMSVSESADAAEGCRALPVEFVHREGGWPSYQLMLPSRALANRIDLVSDDFRWFLYVAGVQQGDYPSHQGAVIELHLHDSPKKGLILGLAEKCRASISDVGRFGECDPCYTWQLQGREPKEWAAVADPPSECVDQKLLEAGPSLIRWSNGHSRCVIDYSMCLDAL